LFIKLSCWCIVLVHGLQFIRAHYLVAEMRKWVRKCLASGLTIYWSMRSLVEVQGPGLHMSSSSTYMVNSATPTNCGNTLRALSTKLASINKEC
jgi:hypothetical protein